ncbi:MAG: hypothetical protein JSW39_17350 [Desulfobacterales bacterium]|nr:MAG: hypothetical protein JSW39_17350 [Desulfobacterales bacterium]
MQKLVAVLDADEKQCTELCALLGERCYRPIALHSLPHLVGCIQKTACGVVIIDIDTVPVDNRIIRDLTNENPGVIVLCVSQRRVHPELAETMGCRIYACVSKPIDPDELFYLLNSLDRNNDGAGPAGPVTDRI